jgi:hypothetical protein
MISPSTSRNRLRRNPQNIGRSAVGRSAERVGRELGLAHDVLCNLRKVGITNDDLVQLSQAGTTKAGQIIALIRDDTAIQDPGSLANFDLEPRKHTSILAGDFLRLLSDDRFGIGHVRGSSGKLIYKNRVIRFVQPTGGAFAFDSEFKGEPGIGYNLNGLTIDGVRHYEHLNFAVAQWFNSHVYPEEAMVPGYYPHEFINCQGVSSAEKVYFLGTLWSNDIDFMAVTLERQLGASYMVLRLESVPKGPWPEKCRVAILADESSDEGQ